MYKIKYLQIGQRQPSTFPQISFFKISIALVKSSIFFSIALSPDTILSHAVLALEEKSSAYINRWKQLLLSENKAQFSQSELTTFLVLRSNHFSKRLAGSTIQFNKQSNDTVHALHGCLTLLFCWSWLAFLFTLSRAHATYRKSPQFRFSKFFS